MKKYIFILLGFGFLAACNNEVDHAEHKTSIEAPTPAAHNEETVLALNDGKKWDSDETSNINVAALKKVLDEFDEKNATTVKDYNVAATNLKGVLDTLIKECRMKGADHDALHAWLEPLMKDVNDLNKTTTEDEAKNLLDQIEERLNEYNKYFE
jgi:hypothetical protein